MIAAFLGVVALLWFFCALWRLLVSRDPLTEAATSVAEAHRSHADLIEQAQALEFDEEFMQRITEARDIAVKRIADDFEAETGVPLATFERELWGDDPEGEWWQGDDWREAL